MPECYPRVGWELTWPAEGNPDPCAKSFNMFTLHVPPGEYSGVTLVGVDLGQQEALDVATLLGVAGLSLYERNAIHGLCGMRGDAARGALQNLCNTDAGYGKPLSAVSCIKFFESFYSLLADDVARIDRSDRVVSRWGLRPPAPHEIEVQINDLRFRGDWNPVTQELLYPYLVTRDWVGFCAQIINPGNWKKVPADRFRRRLDYAMAYIQGATERVKMRKRIAKLETRLAALEAACRNQPIGDTDATE